MLTAEQELESLEEIFANIGQDLFGSQLMQRISHLSASVNRFLRGDGTWSMAGGLGGAGGAGGLSIAGAAAGGGVFSIGAGGMGIAGGGHAIGIAGGHGGAIGVAGGLGGHGIPLINGAAGHNTGIVVTSGGYVSPPNFVSTTIPCTIVIPATYEQI